MKLIIDDKIPYIREAIGRITADAVYLKGSGITADDVRDADAMIVRTRTRCDERLLSGSRVSFIATATIGFDHIDTAYLSRAGIAWMNCPGCNSGSVMQYVMSVLTLLRRDRGMRPENMTIGVVGCGHVGSKVAAAARAEGMRVLTCDPPLEESGAPCPAGEYATLDDMAHEADVITFHVPLTRDGRHKTLHLAGSGFLGSLCRRPVIINTSRGGVVDEAALCDAIDSGRAAPAVIDTWEGEPDISRRLLSRVWIGTPHIAGYSADGKVNADNMAIAGLCRHFNLTPPPAITPPPLPPGSVTATDPDLRRLQLYNPLDDFRMLKDDPSAFENLRGNYRVRRETDA